jgi:hypothetical protein
VPAADEVCCSTGNNQAGPVLRVTALYVELLNSTELQIFDPEKAAWQAACIPLIPVPTPAAAENPWNSGALDPAPSRAVIRVLLSSTAAFTAVKFAFISDALVVAPELNVLGIVNVLAVLALAKISAAIAPSVLVSLFIFISSCLRSIYPYPILTRWMNPRST